MTYESYYEKPCHRSIVEGLESNPLTGKISFCRWAICLPRWILKSRTSLSWHLRIAFTATWRGASSPTATFPLPLPFPGAFDSSGPKLSGSKLFQVAKRRLLNLVVICLNQLYLGRFATSAELGRCPNSWQRACYQRLMALLVACGDGHAEVSTVPGRSGPELAASLFQMEHFADHLLEPGQSYAQAKPVHFTQDQSLCPAEDHPELQPYKNLQADRLKFVGDGSWDMASYLDGVLWLPYVEPRFLLHGFSTAGAALPSFENESRDENLRLAKIWDTKGLLRLHRQPLVPGHFSRVFNAHKSEKVDRQIGDRRVPNAREYRLDGPSRHLPPGFMLTNLKVERGKEVLRASITDRRDFYHQALVTGERAQSNMLPFRFSDGELTGCVALANALQAEQDKRHGKRRPREATGDGFGFDNSNESSADGWFASFGSLFQGDHLGVEFALQSHETLLKEHGALDQRNRILGHGLFPLSPRWEGLIIDDYFAIGREAIGSPAESSFAYSALEKARGIYEKGKLPGSIEKDIEAETTFKAAGAEVRSDEGLARNSTVTVGAPFAKRLALATLSLRAAVLPLTSAKLLVRLAGNWTSVLMFRRCYMAVVDKLFSTAAEAEASGANVAVPLPRKVAEELCFLSILSPILVSNVAVDYDSTVYASDASLGAGAVCQTQAPPDVSEVLWLGSDKRGCYTRLDGFARATLAAAERSSTLTLLCGVLLKGPPDLGPIDLRCSTLTLLSSLEGPVGLAPALLTWAMWLLPRLTSLLHSTTTWLRLG